jgi:hypothetical protein
VGNKKCYTFLVLEHLAKKTTLKKDAMAITSTLVLGDWLAYPYSKQPVEIIHGVY